MSLCRAFYWVTILVAKRAASRYQIIIRCIPGPALEIAFSRGFFFFFLIFKFFLLHLCPHLKKFTLGPLILLTHAQYVQVISVNCDIVILHQSPRLLEGVQERDVRDQKKQNSGCSFGKIWEKNPQQALSCVIQISVDFLLAQLAVQ